MIASLGKVLAQEVRIGAPGRRPFAGGEAIPEADHGLRAQGSASQEKQKYSSDADH